MNPSPSVSARRSGRQNDGRGSCQCPARKDLWSQAGSRAELLVANAKGHQRGVEQHPDLWNVAVSAMVWSLPQLYLEVVHSTLMGPWHPDDKWGISPRAYLWVVPLCKHSRSGPVYRYLRCFPLEPRCHGWLAAILGDMSDSILFYILYVTLMDQCHFVGPALHMEQQNRIFWVPEWVSRAKWYCSPDYILGPFYDVAIYINPLYF